MPVACSAAGVESQDEVIVVRDRTFIVIALGTMGDLHPLLAIANELRQRGRKVTLLGSEQFREHVERTGVAFVPVSTKEQYANALQDPGIWDAREGFATVWRSMEPVLVAVHQWLLAHCSGKGTVVITHPLALSLSKAIREKGLIDALVAVYLAPSNMKTTQNPMQLADLRMGRWVPQFARRLLWQKIETKHVDPVALPLLNRLRSDLGLSPIAGFLSHMTSAADLSLALFPQWFAPYHGDWPQPMIAGDFLLYDSTGTEALNPELEAFLQAGEAPLVFTLGSGMRHADDFFRESTDACIALGRRGLLLTMYDDQLPPLPASVLWVRYAPFRVLLYRTALLVHHGGIGTCAEALRAGIPQLIMPMAHDQFDNAARVERLGTGKSIKRDTYGGQRLVRVLRDMLSSQDLQDQCRNYAKEFSTASRVDSICDELERALL